MAELYNWKRFWCPRSGSINLADGGYLSDPEATWGKIYNPDLVAFETLSSSPCLALLGEPGIGKTKALEAERAELVSRIKEQGNQPFFLDLRSYGDESRLVQKLFASPEFVAWQGGTHQLHIFLDSLDECLLRIDTLASLLVDEFKQYQDQAERLYLRIACRTAVWPTVLEEGLRAIWGEDAVGVYELAPLRRVDVAAAASAEGFSADDFLKELGQKKVVPLAIKPVTLGFLVNTYRRHNNQFPANQKLYQLYLEGCRLLCEETNANRHSSNQTGDFDVEQRLIVAARIAAITIFANKFAVWNGVDQGDVPDEDILLRKLCQGHESINGNKFEINQDVIEEVLNTGLFSSRGLQRMGWAHQTYAEFLAAWYLVQYKVPLVEVRDLLFSHEDPDHRLIPQLHETAAWLASMDSDILQEILKTDPDVLLQSDLPTDNNVRLLIVENLLILHEQKKLVFRDWDKHIRYEKLNHSKLANQLRSYICDSSRQDDARDLAIDIAKACEINELQEELVVLALDSSQSIYLRINAANSLCSLGDEKTRLKLKPLAMSQLSEDEDDQLKGYALRATWPEWLTAEEIFQTLTPPKKGNFFGGYQAFIDREFALQLQPNDLIVALEWLQKQGLRCFGHPFDKLGNTILLKAWENFDLPGIVKSFTKIALLQWKDYQEIITQDSDLTQQFATTLVSDSRKRRIFLEQLVLFILETQENPNFLLSSVTENILLEQDVFWMVEKTLNSSNENMQRLWAQLLQWSFNQQDAKQVDIIIIAAQTNSILREVFTYYLEIIELDSAQAEQLRSDYVSAHTRRQSPTLLDPPPKERVLQLLEKLENGDLDAWWHLNREMTLKSDSKYYENESELDLTKLPGWQEAEKITQRRIIEGAKQYIDQKDDVDSSWIGTNTYSRPAKAGCRALQLIFLEDKDFLDTLLAEKWKKWAATVIASPSSSGHDDSYLEIVKLAYRYAAQESINTLMILIDHDNQEYGSIFATNRFGKCWDDRLKLALLEKAKDPLLKPKCIGQLLEELLKRGLNQAGDFAQSLIQLPLPVVEPEHERTLIGARILFENSDSSNWSFLWALIKQDTLFGREVLESGASRYSSGMKLHITETQIANLYIWLVNQYPYDEDSDYSNDSGTHSVTDRDCMGRLRDNVISQLEERGTLQACTELQRLIQELPNIVWLEKSLITAKSNMRQKTWKPPEVEAILQLNHLSDKSQGASHVTNHYNFDQRNSTIGVNVANEGSNIQLQQTINNNLGQSLTEAAAEIQRLLKQLEQANPAATESEQIGYVSAATNPEIKQRAIAALLQGGETAIEEFVLENKYLKVGKSILKGWLNPNG